MYLEHFGLQERPFSLTPDTQFFLNGQSHRQALNTMLLSLSHSEGFIKIVGEVGTGKTILCRKLLASLDSRYLTAYVPNPYLTPDELKSYLAGEIGAQLTDDMKAHQVMFSIYRRLIQLARRDKRVVLIIDEAQAMPVETIEALRLLTNLETEKRKLVQVVLLGQPELDDLLNRPDLRQLKQRIVFSEYLKPFSWKGVKTYLDYRLNAAGATEKVFSSPAVWLIYKGSGGIPRLMNVIAHKAMMLAYGQGDKKVKARHVAKAIVDTDESSRIGKFYALRWRLLWPVVGAVTATLCILLPQWLGGAL
ncbi:ExeA family protein [Candidatus Pelagadaptatus aseana]|uniref:ExeA family protein n=1 Tax=Candidatus Pelagadaptatus aseana TaxID=3120508 RepID=UPI003C6F268A